LRAALNHNGPVYIRLGKKNEPIVHQQSPNFVIGQGITMRHGKDVCLLSTGTMLPIAMQAADEIAKQGFSAQVVSFHTIKPLDKKLLTNAFAQFTVVTTIEEHSILGGLGGSVAEWLAAQSLQKARLCQIGTTDTFLHEVGDQNYARAHFGLTAENIAEKTLTLYQTTVSN
jgi:transketolase